jgi:hypothetical protein
MDRVDPAEQNKMTMPVVRGSQSADDAGRPLSLCRRSASLMGDLDLDIARLYAAPISAMPSRSICQPD